ncbi:MAG: GNAT family N-acetyltransferase [archaeon]|nr:GNAT family N-acetyltransferase [archaeon]
MAPSHPLRYVFEENEHAVMMYVEGPEFVFVDYIAVDVEQRGMGLGTTMISRLMEKATSQGKFMLLEVDPPVSPSDQKRVSFYERLGLELYLDITYSRMWSYDPSSPPCQMLLMATVGTPADRVRDAMRNVYTLIHSWNFQCFYGSSPPSVDAILP